MMPDVDAPGMLDHQVHPLVMEAVEQADDASQVAAWLRDLADEVEVEHGA